MTTNDYKLVQTRYSFDLPPLYRELQTAGCFDYTQPEKVILFTDHEWMSLQEIAHFEFYEWQNKSREFFIPFARTRRRHTYGWRKDWINGEEAEIVFCEHGPFGSGFALDFRAFLYRMLLQEFSGTSLLKSPNDGNGKAKIRRAVQVICPRLPTDWARRIDELSRQPWYTEDKMNRVYSMAHCETIIQMDLSFPHLDEEFRQGELTIG